MNQNQYIKAFENTFGRVHIVSGNEYKITCFVCGKNAMWLNPKKNQYICFFCESSGRLDSIVPDIGIVRMTMEEAIGRMNKADSVEVNGSSSVLPENYKPIRRRLDFPEGWDYVVKRRVDPNSVEFGFYDKVSICFPVRENGKVVYWQSRMIYDELVVKTRNPKITTAGIGRDDVVYRLEACSVLTIIVEGVFDALRVNGVSTLGKRCTSVQAAKILRRQPRLVCICYDPDSWKKDKKGRIPILQALKSFRSYGVPVVPIQLFDSSVDIEDVSDSDIAKLPDPADLGREGVEHYIREQCTTLHSPQLALFGVTSKEVERWLLETRKVVVRNDVHKGAPH